MSSVFAKLRDFVGLNDPADYEYEYEETDGEEYQN
ncbi:MAG: cell division protein SepF, partial [Nodosilinea sp.]